MSDYVELTPEQWQAVQLAALPVTVIHRELARFDALLVEWRTPAKFLEALDALTFATNALEAMQPSPLLDFWRDEVKRRIEIARGLRAYARRGGYAGRA